MAIENSHSPSFSNVTSQPVATNPQTGSVIERPVHKDALHDEDHVSSRRSAHERHDASHQHRSIPGLIADLSRDVTTLFRQEIELVRAEMREKVSELEKGIAMATTAGVIGLAGVIFLMLSLMFALSFVWPLWASALTVGIAGLAIAGALAAGGKKKVSAEHLAPERTKHSLQENRQFAKEQFA